MQVDGTEHHYEGLSGPCNSDGDSTGGRGEDGFPLLCCRLMILAQVGQGIRLKLFYSILRHRQAAIVQKQWVEPDLGVHPSPRIFQSYCNVVFDNNWLVGQRFSRLLPLQIAMLDPPSIRIRVIGVDCVHEPHR